MLRSQTVRLRISLDGHLVAEIDRRVGSRRRGAFIAELIRRGLENEHRWDEIDGACGALPDSGHEWDEDPAGWVRRQRRADARRSG